MKKYFSMILGQALNFLPSCYLESILYLRFYIGQHSQVYIQYFLYPFERVASMGQLAPQFLISQALCIQPKGNLFASYEPYKASISKTLRLGLQLVKLAAKVAPSLAFSCGYIYRDGSQFIFVLLFEFLLPSSVNYQVKK